MNNKLTYALITLFFGGLVAVWWADRAGIKTNQQADALKELVLPELDGRKASEVARVELSGAGGPEVAFERRGGDRWQMVTPVEALADRGKVDSFLASLKNLRKSRDAGVVEGPADRFGLGSPRVVKLLGPGGASAPLATLELGDGKSLAGLRYVRPAGGPIVVVDALPLAAADQPAADWRERSLLDASSLDVWRLKIGGPGRDLAAARRGQHWQITGPIQAPGDDGKFEGVVADLTALHAEDGAKGFVAEGVTDWKKYGLDTPDLTIEVGGGGGPDGKERDEKTATQVVRVSAPLPGKPDRAYARRDDQDDVILVNPKALASLGKSANDLRSHKVANFDKAKADYLVIRVGTSEHELARTPAGWAVVRRSGGKVEPVGKADEPLVATLLAKLEGLETSEFLDPKHYPEARLDAPAAAVKLWEVGSSSEALRAAAEGPTGEPTLDLTLGNRNPLAKVVYARSAGDPSTLLALPEAIMEAFPSGPLAYRDRTVLSQDRFALDRLTVRRAPVAAAGPPLAVLQSPATPHPGPESFGQWQLTEPVKAPADPQAVARLAVLLSGLRAEALVAEEADPKAYGLDAPWLSVAWTPRPGANASARALDLGKEVPGGSGARFARLSGSKVVFTVHARAVEILDAELRDHTLLAFPAEKVSQIELRWPGRSIALARDPAGTAKVPAWMPRPGADLSGFEVARVNTLLESLANLQAARFTQYDGPIPAAAGLASPAFEAVVTLGGETTPRVVRLGAPGPRFADQTTRHAAASADANGAVALLAGPLWELWVEPPARAGELPANPFAPVPP